MIDLPDKPLREMDLDDLAIILDRALNIGDISVEFTTTAAIWAVLQLIHERRRLQ